MTSNKEATPTPSTHEFFQPEKISEKIAEKSADKMAVEKPLEKSPEKTKKSWSVLNHELKEALNTWEILSEEVATKVSPEEQQLQEVKRLLTELKDKLKQFSE